MKCIFSIKIEENAAVCDGRNEPSGHRALEKFQI